MTETIIQKLEEKVLAVLSELEKIRRELHHVQQENSALRNEKEMHTNKLQNLLSLLDSMGRVDDRLIPAGNIAIMDAVFQG